MEYIKKDIVGDCELYNGDCLDILPHFKNKFSCIFTDIPYIISNGGCAESSKFGTKNKLRNDQEKLDLYKKGKIFQHNNIEPEDYIPLLYDCLEERGHIYLMINHLHLSNTEMLMKKCGFKINNILVMRKNNCVTNQFYMKDIEFVIFARKGAVKPLHNMSLKSCIDVIMPNNKTKIHDTEKPVDYIQLLIENSTNENDYVLDPFMGSASTGIACMNSNRKFVGIEIDSHFYDKSMIRLKTQKQETSLF